jgi:RNA polymerase-binding transcription factor DksA
MTNIDVQKYEKRLQDRLHELNERLESIEDDLDEPADPDAEERATEREGDEVLENLGNAGLAEIKMIQAALARIKNGTYGICVACGEPVSEERLDAVPHAPRCRNCA